MSSFCFVIIRFETNQKSGSLIDLNKTHFLVSSVQIEDNFMGLSSEISISEISVTIPVQTGFVSSVLLKELKFYFEESTAAWLPKNIVPVIPGRSTEHSQKFSGGRYLQRREFQKQDIFSASFISAVLRWQ